MNVKGESVQGEGGGGSASDAAVQVGSGEARVSAKWNDVRFVAGAGAGSGSGAQAGHVESYFLKLNDPEGRRALWLKATILERRGGDVLAEAWAIAFDRESGHVAVKDSVPLAEARFGAAGLDAKVCNLQLSPGRVAGSVGHGDKAISFDLRFTMDSPPLVPFPSERMYLTRLPSTKLVSPHPDSRFTGTYTAKGETVDVNAWRGMEGHNWGTRHTELYAWCHVNQWQGDDTLLFEGFTGRVKVGPVLAPPVTLLCVWHRDVRYHFNDPMTLVRARGHIQDLRKWTFHAKNHLAEVSGEMFAETTDFAGLAYENPDGTVTNCLNSKIARGRLRLSVKGRADVDVITNAAAFEIGTKNARHGVQMLA